MRSKNSYLVPAVLGLMLTIAIAASAQENVPIPGQSTSGLISQDPVYDEKPLLMEQPTPRLSHAADSLQSTRTPSSSSPSSATTNSIPSKSKGNDPKKPQTEGDPLNFNFLYYIIQKFKASDLMMQ